MIFFLSTAPEVANLKFDRFGGRRTVFPSIAPDMNFIKLDKVGRHRAKKSLEF